MKIAITGSDGYIGRRLCSALEREQSIELLKLSVLFKGNGFLFTDYSYDSLCGVLKGVDLVIHLAAVRSGQSLIDFYPNFDITENLLNAMGHCGIKKMIFMSSIAVYSDENNLPWKESQTVNPYTLYGIGKLTCESLCMFYGKKYAITTLILRLAPIYGPFDNNKRMIAFFMKNANENKTILVKGKSLARRDFIFVNDVINVLVMYINDFPQKTEIVNVGPNENHTNLEIAKLVREGFNSSSEIVYDDSNSEGICSAYMDVSRLLSKGFKPTPMLTAFVQIAKEERNV